MQESSPEQHRVLVMDDEHSILALLTAALQRLGFEPVTTTSGEAAVSALLEAQEGRKPFDLAILDLIVPQGMGGEETALELRRLQPELLLVASSGYTQSPVLRDYKKYGFDQVLVKPYRIPDLASLLRGLIARRDRARS